MPTLFISYKRGTTAVAPLMEKLCDAHYRLWFDRDEIRLGDPDWQARIDQGIQHCDGMILNITPAACQSEPVRYEVKKARELNKPIFPVILERITDYDAAIRDLGLAEKQHIEDFTDVTRWNEQIERLLRDLEAQGLTVTRHDRRQQRDRNNPAYVLHQTYLKRLAERIGTLNLAQINPENMQGVELEQVYVDSPTDLSLSVEVDDGRITDWWISLGIKTTAYWGRPRPAEQDLKWTQTRRRPDEFGFEPESLESLLYPFPLDEVIAENRETTPDKKPKYQSIRWRDGEYLDQVPLHLKHLAAACDRMVILGAPGSGKSTFVKFLALCLAGSGIDNWTRSVNIQSLDNWSHGTLTPVYVELRRFVASQHFPDDVKTPATTDHLWSYIQHELLGNELKAYADYLKYDLEHGHAVLILDGLDEVPYPKRNLKERQQQLISLVQSLNTRYATSRIIVASRPYAYEGWALPGFQSVTIAPFETDHRVDLASRLYRAAGLVELVAQEKAQSLENQLDSIDEELKDRPLFVTLMATIYLRGDSEGLPMRRGALYRESVLLLLDRWTASKPNAPSLQQLLGAASLGDLYARLAQLAYEVHSAYGEQKGEPEIPVMLLDSCLMKLERKTGADPVKLYAYLSENAGVLVSPGQDGEKEVFHFAHRTFQEYLAAVHLVSLCTKADSFDLVCEHITSRPQVWRVPCTLVGDVLADTNRRIDLWHLLAQLLEDNPPDNGINSRWWLVWLASTISSEHKLYEQAKLNRLTEQPAKDALIDWLVALIEMPQALPPVERAACGRALSLLGDPRPGVGTLKVTVDGKVVELPDIVWCDIPAPPNGKFIMGASDRLDNPRRRADLKYNFKMSKYLITYQQFQTFIDSGEYDDPRWWQGFPEKYQSQKMGKQYTPYLNHPRDSVSWYQAVAFCRWVTVQYWRAGLIGDTVEIRLPTEVEWEYVARGGDEHIYPYRTEFDTTKGNTFETGINWSSAVGLFPDGASPFGVLDMSGNLWEWCLNDYETPDTIINFRNEMNRVLRGGSFDDLGSLATTVYRNSVDFANYWNDFYGFRVVACPC